MLTDVETLAKLPGFTASEYDATMQQMAVESASELIERACDRTFASTEYTETLDGDGTDVLFPRQYPISSVASLVINEEAVADYEALEQSIYRKVGFPRGRRNIEVTYTAGYATIPSTLKLTATRLAADILRGSKREGAVTSSKLADWGETYAADNTDLLAPYKAEIAKFRRITL
jgi:hypothetical protein